MKNSVEYRNLSIKELSDSVVSTEKELQRLKFAHAISPLENPRRITHLRKTVASMKTVLNEKVTQELGEKISAGEVTTDNIYSFLNKGEYPITLRKSRIKSLFAKAGK